MLRTHLRLYTLLKEMDIVTVGITVDVFLCIPGLFLDTRTGSPFSLSQWTLFSFSIGILLTKGLINIVGLR
jgi:hypothetical protein